MMFSYNAAEQQMILAISMHHKEIGKAVSFADPYLRDTDTAVKAIMKLAAKNGWSAGVTQERAYYIAEDTYDDLLRELTGEGLCGSMPYEEFFALGAH